MRPQYITRYFLPVVLLATALASTEVRADDRYRDYRVDTQRYAYARGYEEGREDGWNDARRGRRFDPRRHNEFRHADSRYSRRDGNRGAYRELFRRGFIAGYQEAFRAYSRNRGWDGRRDRIWR